MELATVTSRVLGARQPEPAARVVQDQQFAMIPIYFQTALAQGLIIATGAPPALAGFLTKKSAQGTVHGQMVRQRRNAVPTLQAFRAEKMTRTFHLEITQCTPFRESEWLTAGEALRAGLKEAIDTFIDFVVSGATSIGA